MGRRCEGVRERGGMEREREREKGLLPLYLFFSLLPPLSLAPSLYLSQSLSPSISLFLSLPPSLFPFPLS